MMPELPEVETVRRDLESEIVGRRVAKVSVTGARSVRRQDRSEFSAGLTGATVESIRRHGKFLLFDLDDGNVVVAHLRMSGQFQWVPDPAVDEEKHTHVRWRFTDGTELRFVDPRTFGEMWVMGPASDDLAHLGPDALDVPFDDFVTALGVRKTTVKAALLNQEVVAGVGNIYADEMLWRARVRPTRLVTSLTSCCMPQWRHAVRRCETLAMSMPMAWLVRRKVCTRSTTARVCRARVTASRSFAAKWPDVPATGVATARSDALVVGRLACVERHHLLSSGASRDREIFGCCCCQPDETNFWCDCQRSCSRETFAPADGAHHTAGVPAGVFVAGPA
jgi:formamidopyrimidine-DNA glycosylase